MLAEMQRAAMIRNEPVDLNGLIWLEGAARRAVADMRQLARKVRGEVQPSTTIGEHIRAPTANAGTSCSQRRPRPGPAYPTPSPRKATHGERSRRREASYKATDDGRPRMIRVERHEEVRPGFWRYTVPGFGIEGRSRQPLLDACRQIRAILGETSQRAGLFREGRTEADISCSVNKGALLTVEDGPKGIRFRKYREFDRLAADDIAEAAAE
jgi:hypothetical protein